MSKFWQSLKKTTGQSLKGWKDKECYFGSFNPNTGECQDGYIDKQGRMRFKRNFWRNLFSRPPSETAFITTLEVEVYNILTGRNRTRHEALYKDFNPVTGQITKLYSKHCHGTTKFDINAWNKHGTLVPLN